MKKIIVIALGLIFISAAGVLAQPQTATYYLNCSNVLMSGTAYGKVVFTDQGNCIKVEVDPYPPYDPTPGCKDKDPMGPNYGIKTFGLNYAGTDSLSFTYPANWTVQGPGNPIQLDGVGKFEIVLGTTAGLYTQDPLVFTICSANDLSIDDFTVASPYYFGVHIMDFCYYGNYDITSAWFAPGCDDGATAITLSSFTAVPGNSVTLNWVTETEIDTSGFNILRADKKKGVYEQINEALIPSEGSETQGASYEFVDNDVRKGKKYFYKLEDIDRNGTSTLHGPVKVKVKKK